MITNTYILTFNSNSSADVNIYTHKDISSIIVKSAILEGSEKNLVRNLKCTQLFGMTTLCHFTYGLQEISYELSLTNKIPLQGTYTFYITDINGNIINLKEDLIISLTLELN